MLRFPRVADRFVVDEADAVGRNGEELGCERGQALRLDVVAVGREALEAVPEAGDRAGLVAEPQRVGIGAGAESVGDGFPDVVVGERLRRPVARRPDGAAIRA